MKRKWTAAVLAGIMAVGTLGTAGPVMADSQDSITVYVSVEKTLVYDVGADREDVDYILEPTAVTLDADDGYTMKAVAQKLAEEGVDLRRTNNGAWTAASIASTAADAFYISGIGDPNAPSTCLLYTSRCV